MTKPPPVLRSLLNDNTLDLYQTSFFIGPSEAVRDFDIGYSLCTTSRSYYQVTPLHYDPYMNCFSLQAASDPTRFAKHLFAKHFFLLPPSTSSIVRPPLDSRSSHVQRNTSHLDFYLQNSHAAPVSSSTALDRVYVDGLTDADAEKLSRIAMSCVLKEGDTLFIPRGWWHRVENVDMSWHHGSPEGLCGGWTAGVAWWFLFR